jgi:hypothetical protein
MNINSGGPWAFIFSILAQPLSVVRTVRKQCYPYPIVSGLWVLTGKHPFGRYRADYLIEGD